MAKTKANANKEWTPSHNAKLKSMAKHGKPTGLIAWELGRSKPAIYSQASQLGVSLKPTNKPPYNRPASGK